MRNDVLDPSQALALAAVPGATLLDAWTRAEWGGGCQLDELAPSETLSVMTMNHRYEIVVLDGPEGRIRIRGGEFFPGWQDARLIGSVMGSLLKRHGIYVGCRLEIRCDTGVVVTSPVQDITLWPAMHG